MKEIPLTQGKVAIVDDVDYERLSQHKWCAHKHRDTFYAQRGIWVNKKVKYVSMHREILGLVTNGGGITDHKDQNGLHNWRNNLRIVTLSVNNHNCKMRRNNSTGYRGVCWHKASQSFTAKISVNGKRIHLGCFPSVTDAAKAYDAAAIKHHRESCKHTLNFPEVTHA